MIQQYYIFDITEGIDDVHGEIIIVRAGAIHHKMVSESPSDWALFFFKNTSPEINEIVSMARKNGGYWTVNFSEFRESRIDYEGKARTVYYHRSLPKKHNFWSRLFHK